MKQNSDICKEICLSLLLTFLFLPSNFGNNCTGSKLQIDPSLVTKLDLSQCKIHSLQESDFKQYPYLQTLNLSHNLLEEIDFSLFRFNSVLDNVDISHNKLQIINCSSLQFINGIKSLNMSYNNFQSMYLCQEFGLLKDLEYLGLSSEKIEESDFAHITHLKLKSVFLGLEGLQEYSPGSLKQLHTEKLHITSPKGFFISIDSFFYDVFTCTETLEISQIVCTTCPLGQLYLRNKNTTVSTLILSNIVMPWSDMSMLIQGVWKSSVQHLFINGFTIIEELNYVPIDVSRGSIQTLYIDNIIPLVFEYYDYPLPIFSEMFVQNLTLSNAKLMYFFCPKSLRIFQSLNFANNHITDGIFQQCRSLPYLQYLNLHNNKLEKLLSLSSMTLTMDSLQHLDVSFNSLFYEDTDQCEWSRSVVSLNLSRNRLTDSVFKCLPSNVEILDLSRNQIKSISKDIRMLTALREINLAFNQLNNIPDCSYMSKNLMVLNIDNNAIFSPSIEFFGSCNKVKTVSARDNTFDCSCEMRSFVSSVQSFKGEMVGWPTSYRCELPEIYRGVMLNDLHLSEVSCNVYLLIGIVVGSVLIVIFLIVFTCKYFDLPWYLKMIFQWLRRKYRVKQVDVTEIQRSKRFHAFVSYSQKDGDWVRNLLLPNLEKEGSVRICLHERDFIPGKAIIDNIICCIEISFKSIFVLSPNFLQSEWCHYELYFAQHYLFGKTSENLILVLLEPIPQYLIPDKYSKLKALMNQRTYMEWPKEKAKQGLFWANLRGAIEIDLSIQEGELPEL